MRRVRRLSVEELEQADRTADRWLQENVGRLDPFVDRGAARTAPEREQKRSGLRAEIAVAGVTGLPWREGRKITDPDVGEMLEVRFRPRANGYSDLCLHDRDLDRLARPFVLVWPAPDEPVLPAAFALVGWALGRELWDAPTYVDRVGRRYFAWGKLRPIDELIRLVEKGLIR